MFYKIGFYVLLVLLILCAGLFMKTNPMKTTGAPSWLDIYSDAPAATIGFLSDNFGITVTKTTPTTIGSDYHIIKASGQLWPFAGIMETPSLPGGTRVPAGTVVYLTVLDYAAAHEKAMASGATAVMADMKAEDMTFGYYIIPGGVTIGIVQYGKK